jgi:hypothetical protein
MKNRVLIMGPEQEAAAQNVLRAAGEHRISRGALAQASKNPAGYRALFTPEIAHKLSMIFPWGYYCHLTIEDQPVCGADCPELLWMKHLSIMVKDGDNPEALPAIEAVQSILPFFGMNADMKELVRVFIEQVNTDAGTPRYAVHLLDFETHEIRQKVLAWYAEKGEVPSAHPDSVEELASGVLV